MTNAVVSKGPIRCQQYGHKNKAGQPCNAIAITGMKGCRRHVGMPLMKAKAKGAVVTELRSWGLDSDKELRDPGEVLLRLVTQSAARVELYSRLLQEAYNAAAKLDDDEPEGRAELKRVFRTNGVGALIGHKYGVGRDGEVFAEQEAIRGLVMLEGQERDRCAGFASKAIAAGLAERQVRLAEQQGAAMFALFSRVLAALNLDSDQQAMVPAVLEAEIAALTA